MKTKTFTTARGVDLTDAFALAHEWFEEPVHLDAVALVGQESHWTFSTAAA